MSARPRLSMTASFERDSSSARVYLKANRAGPAHEGPYRELESAGVYAFGPDDTRCRLARRAAAFIGVIALCWSSDGSLRPERPAWPQRRPAIDSDTGSTNRFNREISLEECMR